MKYLSQLEDLYQAKGLPYQIRHGVFWHRYRGMVEPRGPLSHVATLSQKEAQTLRKDLDARLIRWFGPPAVETDGNGWYAVMCEQPVEWDAMKSKHRKKLQKALEQSECRLVDLSKEAESVFEVYLKAHARYRGNKVVIQDRQGFLKELSVEAAFPDLIQYFGVYVEKQLVGYSKMYLFDQEETMAAVTKLDPNFLSLRISETLTHQRNDFYLKELGIKRMRSGFRNLEHQTEVQAFNNRFGFQAFPLPLYVQYGWPLNWGMPILRLANKLPVPIPTSVQALIQQDQLRSPAP